MTKRVWEGQGAAQFVQDKETGKYVPDLLKFTDADKAFLHSVGWAPVWVSPQKGRKCTG